MDLCVVTETYPPEINGVATTLGHLVAGMRARGHRVSLVRPRQRGVDAPGLSPDATTTLVAGARLPGYRGLQIGLPSRAALIAAWARHHPDAVYVATEGPLGWSAVRAGGALGIPVYSGFHTNFHRYAGHYRASWLRAVISVYLRRFHNATAGTLVATTRLRDELAAAGFRNLGVLGRGVDSRRFDPARRSTALRSAWGASDDDLVVLYVGRLAPEKNVGLAIEAYRAMLTANRRLRFVMVGDGPLRPALERNHPDVVFRGFRTGDDLAAHYASGDVFLFPSETETFGNVTLEAMASGLAVESTRDLGMVLGPLHPLIADNIARLKDISGLDEVSFHMSGTEAVMAAVRLARFNTGRKLIVCFSGAYHGWWDGVQPGLGSERAIGDCLTLKDLHPASLGVIRRRAGEIAGVLVNPVQSFHPNAPPPNDAVLLTSDVRKTRDASGTYAEWLRRLRDVCREAGVPLIFDEVYTGFRLAPGGAQEYFGVRADMVVYGKTVAGGMPIGVVCATKTLMRRFDPERPMRVAYVVRTFSAHPAVMGAMNEFLRWVGDPTTPALYSEMNDRCTQWGQATNRALAAANLPVRVVNLASVWTVLFVEPGRYNWLLQYYLRAEGVTLSWVGRGRCLGTMDFTEKDYEALQTKLVAAAGAMQADGWWLGAEHPRRERTMRRRLIKEALMMLVPVPRPVRSFYAEVMRRKKDDHVASHSDIVNQLFHIVSSSVFLGCYVLAFWDLTTAMWAGLAALFLRQTGHAILEPPCHDKEATLLGYNTRNKTMILGTYLLIPVVNVVWSGAWTVEALRPLAATVAYQWFLWTAAVVAGRVAYLVWAHGPRLALVWFVKLATDPLTDVIAYSPRFLRPA